MTPGSRPRLEVADIFRAAGARYREAHGTTLGIGLAAAALVMGGVLYYLRRRYGRSAD